MSVDVNPKYNFFSPYWLNIFLAVFIDPYPLASLLSATLKRAWSNGVKTKALGRPATKPLNVTYGRLNFYLSGSYVLLMYFFKVSTVPNCRATCGPTPSKFTSIPL